MILKLILVFIVDICVFICISKLISLCTQKKGLLSFSPLRVLFYKEFVAFTWIGASLIVAGYGSSYYRYSLIIGSGNGFIVWTSVILASIAVFFTIYVLNRKLKSHAIRESTYWFTGKYDVGYSEKKLFLIILVCCIASMSCYAFYCISHGYIPLIKMMLASSEDLSNLRYNDKFLDTGNALIKNVLLFLLPPIVSYAAFLQRRKTPTLKWDLAFFISIVVTIVCTTTRFEKSYLIYYLLGFSFTMWIPKGEKDTVNERQRREKTLRWVAAIVVFGMLYVAFVGRVTLSSIYSLAGSLNRIIFAQVTGLYLHYSLFPGQIGFLGFEHFPAFVAAFFGVEQVRSARLVMLATNNSQTAGNQNTFFLGEAYANGGVIAAVLAPIIVGLSIYFLFFIFTRLRRNPFSLGAFMYVCMDIPITGGFLDFLYKPTNIIIFALACLVNVILYSGSMGIVLNVKKSRGQGG